VTVQRHEVLDWFGPVDLYADRGAAAGDRQRDPRQRQRRRGGVARDHGGDDRHGRPPDGALHASRHSTPRRGRGMMPEHPTVPVWETGALQTSASTEALYVTERLFISTGRCIASSSGPAANRLPGLLRAWSSRRRVDGSRERTRPSSYGVWKVPEVSEFRWPADRVLALRWSVRRRLSRLAFGTGPTAGQGSASSAQTALV